MNQLKCPQCSSTHCITLDKEGEPNKAMCLDCDYEDEVVFFTDHPEVVQISM